MSRANPSLSRVLSVAGLLLATPLAVAGPLQTVTRVGVHSREARSEVDLAPRDVIDFERHTPAGLVTETLSLFGDGPILIRGARRDLDAGNAALVIDSADPGQATDLGTPGSSFGGYGIGSDGQAGRPFENSARLGHVLTVADSLRDADGDGLIDLPGDADGAGDAVLDIDFSAIGPVVLHNLTLIDVKSTTAAVVFYAENGEPLTARSLPNVGDNGTTVFDLGDVRGVSSMRVRLDGSGAIDDVVFSRDSTGRIVSSVWYDANRNGLHDVGERGIPDVDVELLDGFGRLIDVTTTRYDGRFLFKNLIAGPYSMRIAPASLAERLTPTLPNVGVDDSLDSELSPATVVLATNDARDETTSFGLVGECGASLGDFVWFDLNENGLQDEGEPGLQGIRLELFAVIFKGDGKIFTKLIDSTTTDEAGAWSFEGLCPDLYFVEIDSSSLPPTFEPTLCDVGPDELDSECSPVPVIIRSDSGANNDIDFGFTSPFNGRIGDFVWIDEDCDGFQDVEIVGLLPGNERGLRGARIILNDDMGVIIAETTSTEQGEYEFRGLAAGQYTLEVDGDSIQEGLTPSPCNPGLNDSTDNDCSGVNVRLDVNAAGFGEGQDITISIINDFGYRNDPCGGSGCSRGLWKQFPDLWPAPYTPDTRFDDVFERSYPGRTLGQVLQLDGPTLDLAARASVAALLNAASSQVDFPLSEQDVIDLYAEAVRFNGESPVLSAPLVKDRGRYLQFLNDQICPFGN